MMRTNSTMNGGVRYYVSILPALFPAFVFMLVATRPPINMASVKLDTPIVERVRQIYTSQLFVREKPSNSGPDVEKFLRYVNLPKGNPWCAAFVCWVFGEAGVANPRTGWSPGLFPDSKVIWKRGESGKVRGENRVSGIKNQESRFPQSALRGESGPRNPQSRLLLYPSSLATDNAVSGPPDRRAGIKYQESRLVAAKPSGYASSLATDNRKLATEIRQQVTDIQQPATPRPTDIFALYFPEKGRIAHVGFIDQWHETWLITVEGNTNESGSREGDGVYRKRRLVRTVYKVARYVK